ncbi:MAG TPA: BTAD domain-containing putative transcriptional regulator [Solirubrobacteraceae bacterium]|nr:BTAD domain-containing putative transcriptional regulator [Solirubrobacteraceae bacterium]
MQFLILGPIEVRNDSGAVALGGIKPQAVLAVLLLHANEPVSAERLALALWGEDAPGGAVKTLQVHVSRLRKALGDPQVVTTTAAGYRLRVRDGELDAAEFERLVEDSRRTLAAGDPQQAAAMLRTALALWRGTPLAGLAEEPFAAGEIARLEEQRLAALELRVEADVAAGHHAEVVHELQSLVADNPLREQLVARLMLALYRCGRQTEALETYAAARRRLVEEIGIEPGPQLRDLHEAILRQDATLAPKAAEPELPSQLDPASSPPLEGRERELAWLRGRWERARDGHGSLVALTGVRGAGKSRLAAELARAVHGPGVAVLHTGGEGPGDATLTALRRVREASRPTLLVIDDADRIGAGVHAELERLPRRIAKAPVLVVACARDPLALAEVAAADTLELGPLDIDAVLAIAARYAPEHAADVPAEWLLETSGGTSRRVHELAGQWARREAARHVSAVAGRAEAGRAELRQIEAELTGGVFELQETRERIAPAPREQAQVVCPFKGLAAYDVADAPYFCGRERLVAELVARLVGAPLLGVVGPSGSGKSSVLRAGLLPALASGVLPGSDGWGQALLRPGEHPLRELAGARGALEDRERVVIAVDQFEEVFTVCRDERERAEFIAELVAAATDAGGRYVVVLALRADHYGRCAAYPELSRLLATSNVLVGAMAPGELRRAIEGPAARAGLRVEPELVAALVDDVGQRPGGLPLLSTALLELWQRRDGRHLRHSVYAQMGGVRGAVARLAEDAYAQLDKAQRGIARGVLMRLVGSAEGGAVERRSVALEELEIDQDEDLARVVALLTDRRLLTVSAGTIELAHEALLREWPRLREWVEEDREGLRIRRGLGAAAAEWERLDRDEGALYRGIHLREALEWRAVSDPALNQLEREFLDASSAVRERERATRRRRAGIVFAAVTAVLVAATGGVLTAVFADRQRDIAASRDLATRSASALAVDPGQALTVARGALKRQDTEAARIAVRQATFADRSVSVARAADGIAFDVASSADGRLATAGEDGSVRIWSADGRRQIATIKGHKLPALAVAFSPDGSRVATVGVDGQVALADSDGRNRTVRLQLEDDRARSVQFSRDGTRLVVGTTSGVVGLIAVEGSAPLQQLGMHGDRANGTFNRDGTRVVSTGGADGTARIWTLGAGGAGSIALDHRGTEVIGARFSPDGRRVATAAADGVVRIWDAREGRLVRSIPVDADPLLSVSFSADGRRIVSAGEDGTVRVSDVRGGPPIEELKGHVGLVYDVTYLRGGGRVASTGADGTLRTWTPLNVASLPVAGGGAHAPSGPSFSLDDDAIVSGSADGKVRIWEPRSGRVRFLPPHEYSSHATYSASGGHIVSAGGDAASVRLWDVATGTSRDVPAPDGEKYAVATDAAARRVAIATLDADTVIQDVGGARRAVLKGHTSDVGALDFSRDGKWLASASEDATARIWSARDGAPRRVLRHGTGVVTDVAFSRDASHVATAAADGTVRVWPVAAGPPVLMYGHSGPVTSVGFDRTGRHVVSTGQDGTVRVWNATGGETLVVLHTHRGTASGAAFSPDGRRVVSAGDDGVLRITPCEVCGTFDEVLRLARSRAPRSLDAAARKLLLSTG